ncbi:hypothetical protein ACHAPK_011574, partial [Fusarium culmorum]
FHITVTQDTPLVLVLSQLDDRYFEGLHGQYSFRIHFRLHYKDSPNAEDYIVRSHGNYLMERSVSVKLPDLPAGNYVVYLKVTSERVSNVQSVEQVDKREAAQSLTADAAQDKQEVPPVSEAPPAPVEEDESSDSPVEDWEALYSSDDMARKPRLMQVKPAAAQDGYDSEEEKVPEPWNAICIVGVRVYSKDEYLELRTCLFVCIVFRRSGPVRAQGAYLS